MIPIIEFSEEEIKTGKINHDTLIKAGELYMEEGCLQLNNILPADYIKTLNASFTKRYSKFFKDKDHNDALTVGDKRYMVTVNIETPFNNANLYANPLVMPIMKGILGDNFILNSFGSVVSLPGAKDQMMHYDHPPLYMDDDIDPYIPPYAVTMITPLVELNSTTGTTVMMKKSHRQPMDRRIVSSSEAEPSPYGAEAAYPEAGPGTCLLMDYKLFHAGQANRSDVVRPILYNIYSRPWFRDYANYDKQSELEISKKEFSKVSDEFKHLFKAAKKV